MGKWLADRITNLVDAIVVALVPVILVGGGVVIVFVGTEDVTVPVWLAVLVLVLLVAAVSVGIVSWWRLRAARGPAAAALRRAIMSVTEELEHSEHVLTSPDMPEFFVEHNLADRKWKEHGTLLADAGLAKVHKSVRQAYRSIDAVNNRGVRRGVVYSGGRKTTIMDKARADEARASIREALQALSVVRV